MSEPSDCFRQTQFTIIRVRSVSLGWYRWDGVPASIPSSFGRRIWSLGLNVEGRQPIGGGYPRRGHGEGAGGGRHVLSGRPSSVEGPLAARGQTSAKIPRIGLLWHEASTEEAVIYLGADLTCPSERDA